MTSYQNSNHSLFNPLPPFREPLTTHVPTKPRIEHVRVDFVKVQLQWLFFFAGTSTIYVRPIWYLHTVWSMSFPTLKREHYWLPFSPVLLRVASSEKRNTLRWGPNFSVSGTLTWQSPLSIWWPERATQRWCVTRHQRWQLQQWNKSNDCKSVIRQTSHHCSLLTDFNGF